jgi:hypothetical protein
MKNRSIRKDTTELGARVWGTVDRAANQTPKWAREYMAAGSAMPTNDASSLRRAILKRLARDCQS